MYPVWKKSDGWTLPSMSALDGESYRIGTPHGNPDCPQTGARVYTEPLEDQGLKQGSEHWL